MYALCLLLFSIYSFSFVRMHSSSSLIPLVDVATLMNLRIKPTSYYVISAPQCDVFRTRFETGI